MRGGREGRESAGARYLQRLINDMGLVGGKTSFARRTRRLSPVAQMMTFAGQIALWLAKSTNCREWFLRHSAAVRGGGRRAPTARCPNSLAGGEGGREAAGDAVGKIFASHPAWAECSV
jgi:hypothetical protein